MSWNFGNNSSSTADDTKQNTWGSSNTSNTTGTTSGGGGFSFGDTPVNTGADANNNDANANANSFSWNTGSNSGGSGGGGFSTFGFGGGGSNASNSWSTTATTAAAAPAPAPSAADVAADPLNANNDVVVVEPPADSVMALRFSPRKACNDFVVCTWDSEVRYYTYTGRPQQQPTQATTNANTSAGGGPFTFSAFKPTSSSSSAMTKSTEKDAKNETETESDRKNREHTQMQSKNKNGNENENKENEHENENENDPKLESIRRHGKPVLDVCWSGDGTKIYSVGCENVIKVWDLRKDTFGDIDIKVSHRRRSSKTNPPSSPTSPTSPVSPTSMNSPPSPSSPEPVSAPVQPPTENTQATTTDTITATATDAAVADAENATDAEVENADISHDKEEPENKPTETEALSNEKKKKSNHNNNTKNTKNKNTPRVRYVHHSAPIRCVQYIPENNVLVTGSWDKKLKYWDMRAGVCCGSINVGHKIYCMCARTPIVGLGLSNKHVQIYDLRKPSETLVNRTTPLRHQLRCMDIFPSKDGFAVGSIEGRCAVQMIDDNNSGGGGGGNNNNNNNSGGSSKNNNSNSFSFKCHRHPSTPAAMAADATAADATAAAFANGNANSKDVYAVNSLRFHHNGSFITGGSDGGINFWDRINRSRLAHFPRLSLPITALDLNASGTVLGYCTSYDWSQGYNNFDRENHKPQIYLHTIESREINTNR